jgi:hypothetical protein
MVFSVVTALRTFLVMLAGSIGIAFTLAASTGIRAELWIVGVAAGELYYVSRKSQTLTITTMLALIAANLALTITITAVALARLDSGTLLHVTVPAGGPRLDAVVVKLAFGVIVMLYIGHVYLIQCAKIVLPRDPSARSLVRGSVAGTLVLVGIFSVWVLAVNGVVPAERLARETGTALPALAERLGPVMSVCGSALVVLLLGLSCLRTSTVMFNLVQERLPSRLRVTLTMPRRRGDLLFESRGGPAGGLQLGVRYLGLSDGRARLRVDVQRNGTVDRTEAVVATTWDAGELVTQIPGLSIRTGAMTLDILDAEPNLLRLRVTTTMRLQLGGDWSPAEQGPADVAALPPPLRALALLIVRRGEATLAEAARERGGDVEATRRALDTLVAEGFAERVEANADPRYRIRLIARRDRRMPTELWGALGQPTDAQPADGGRRPNTMMLSARRLALSDVGRFAFASLPIVVVGLLGETLLLTGSASFAGLLGFGGVIANSMTAGVFPVLLLLASRRKGDCVPATVYRILGHPAVVGGVYLMAIANLFLHGLLIYRDAWSRGCALFFGLVVVALTTRMLRRGAFARRVVVELRDDARDDAGGTLAVIAGGHPLTADITVSRGERVEAHHATTVALGNLSKVTAVTVRLPRGVGREVKVWAHRLTRDGASEALAATVALVCRAERRCFDVGLSSGQALATVNGEESRVEIALGDSSER